MTIEQFWSPKSPEDVAPYTLSFSDWLNAKTNTTAADTLVTVAASVSDTDGTTTSPTLHANNTYIWENGQAATTTLSGGTVGHVYDVQFLVTTQQGITARRSAKIQVLDR